MVSWKGVEIGDLVRFLHGNSPMVVDRIYKTPKGKVRFRTSWPRTRGMIRVDADNAALIRNRDLVEEPDLF